MWLKCALLMGAVAGVLPSSLDAQDSSVRVRPGLSLGVTNYRGDFSLGVMGKQAGLALSFESAAHPIGVQLEATYHRFASEEQPCPLCLGCPCREGSQSEAVGIAATSQWNVRGSPGGSYMLGGLGAYTILQPGDARGRAAIGLELGAGVRGPGAGFFSEIRCLRLQGGSSAGWLLGVDLGYRL